MGSTNRINYYIRVISITEQFVVESPTSISLSDSCSEIYEVCNNHINAFFIQLDLQNSSILLLQLTISIEGLLENLAIRSMMIYGFFLSDATMQLLCHAFVVPTRKRKFFSIVTQRNDSVVCVAPTSNSVQFKLLSNQ